jgi:uncharacterized membrane-anchored protein YjiN (DUF445 family)
MSEAAQQVNHVEGSQQADSRTHTGAPEEVGTTVTPKCNGDEGQSATPSPQEPRMPSAASRVWWVATLLLVVMAVLFGVTTYLGSEQLWLRTLQAFAEAAMVGALADWFAVTALFRRPLGLPIPHTGIIPANKSRIGKSLGLFVQSNFLTEQVLDSQVVNITGSFARFLENPANRERVVERVRSVVPHFLEVANDEEIKKFFNQQVEEMVRNADFARGAARMLRLATSNQMHEVFLDEVIHHLQTLFRSNQLWFRHQMREATPWFIPEFVDRKIFDAIARKTEQTLTDALANRNHELRQRILNSLYSLVVRLETSEELQKKAEDLKQVVLASEVFREYIAQVRDSILAGIDSDVHKRDSILVATIERVLRNAVDTLSKSPGLQRRLNRFIRGMLSALVGRDSTFVADLISRTIDGWDTKTLVTKLEEQVGSDLQYIRINGTLVGGLVGLVLFAARELVRNHSN